MGIKIGMVSLGCAKNRVDAELMLGVLLSDGFELETDPAKADAIIVNTCGFIEAAKQESIDTILEMAEYKQDHLKALIVTGCLSKRYAKELPAEMPEARWKKSRRSCASAWRASASWMRTRDSIIWRTSIAC